MRRQRHITGWGGGSPDRAAQWEVLCAGTDGEVKSRLGTLLLRVTRTREEP
jgi:hypothetical protein